VDVFVLLYSYTYLLLFINVASIVGLIGRLKPGWLKFNDSKLHKRGSACSGMG